MSPLAPARPCRVPSCAHVQTQAKPCPVHGPVQVMRWNTDRRPDVVRLRGRANQERRLRVFARDPLCVACAAQGRTTLATVADHALALAEGGADDESNLVGLCVEHHRLKSIEESKRGKVRAR
jgi:5-methylcytosine-specific restriction enzyme A